MPESDHQSSAEGGVDKTIVCPQCGGDVELRLGSKLLRCAYCDTALFLDRSETVQQYQVPELLDEQEARSSLFRWMAGNDTVKDLDRKSIIRETSKTSFPVWYFRVRRSDGEQTVIEPAAATLLPQLGNIRIPAGKLEPYREEEEGVTTIEVSVQLTTARAWLEQQGEMKILETALVRVPLWRCAYSYSGGMYEAFVDAATGSVLAANYPEKAESPYFLITAFGVVVFGLEGLLVSNPLIKLLVFLVSALPLTLIAYWIARKV
jgi:hypothetical protein